MKLSKAQRKVVKILKKGGVLNATPAHYKIRLLDEQRNVIKHIHRRTFNALLNKDIIHKDAASTAYIFLNPSNNGNNTEGLSK